MIYIYVISWIEKLFFHRLHILDFEMLSIETRNQGKKNGNVVRTYIWIRPVFQKSSDRHQLQGFPDLKFSDKVLVLV